MVVTKKANASRVEEISPHQSVVDASDTMILEKKRLSEKLRHPLAVSMIPFENWKINVRAVVARDVWDSLRYYFEATKTSPSSKREISIKRPDWQNVISCRCCGAERNELELHEV